MCVCVFSLHHTKGPSSAFSVQVQVLIYDMTKSPICLKENTHDTFAVFTGVEFAECEVVQLWHALKGKWSSVRNGGTAYATGADRCFHNLIFIHARALEVGYPWGCSLCPYFVPTVWWENAWGLCYSITGILPLNTELCCVDNDRRNNSAVIKGNTPGGREP